MGDLDITTPTDNYKEAIGTTTMKKNDPKPKQRSGGSLRSMGIRRNKSSSQNMEGIVIGVNDTSLAENADAAVPASTAVSKKHSGAATRKKSKRGRSKGRRLPNLFGTSSSSDNHHKAPARKPDPEPAPSSQVMGEPIITMDDSLAAAVELSATLTESSQFATETIRCSSDQIDSILDDNDDDKNDNKDDEPPHDGSRNISMLDATSIATCDDGSNCFSDATTRKANTPTSFSESKCVTPPPESPKNSGSKADIETELKNEEDPTKNTATTSPQKPRLSKFPSSMKETMAGIQQTFNCTVNSPTGRSENSILNHSAGSKDDDGTNDIIATEEDPDQEGKGSPMQRIRSCQGAFDVRENFMCGTKEFYEHVKVKAEPRWNKVKETVATAWNGTPQDNARRSRRRNRDMQDLPPDILLNMPEHGRSRSSQTFESKITMDTALEDELHQLNRMSSFGTTETFGTNGTQGTHGTNSTFLTVYTLDGQVPAERLDDEGRPISLVHQQIIKKKMRMNKKRSVVSFDHPPISSVRERPRTTPEDRGKLFFSSEELDQIEDDRYNTKSDDVEVVALSPSQLLHAPHDDGSILGEEDAEWNNRDLDNSECSSDEDSASTDSNGTPTIPPSPFDSKRKPQKSDPVPSPQKDITGSDSKQSSNSKKKKSGASTPVRTRIYLRERSTG
eukprot:scaffold3876_cov45-Attheya_sp.AAC.1